jgi:hypothetical protein
LSCPPSRQVRCLAVTLSEQEGESNGSTDHRWGGHSPGRPRGGGWCAPGLVESRSWTLMLLSRRRTAWRDVGIRRSSAGAYWTWSGAGRKVAEVAADLGISEQTIYSATSGPHRPRSRGWADDRGEGGAGGGSETDPRARSRAGCASPGQRVAQGAGRPKRRFAAIAVMVAEGLPASSPAGSWKCPNRGSTPGASGLPRCGRCATRAHRDDQPDPRRLPRPVRPPPGSRRAHAGPRHHRRCRGGVAADAQGRPPGHLRAPEVSPHPHPADRQRSCGARLLAKRTRSALGHRHHRAPDARRQGVLRRPARRVLPARRRLVDRLDPNRRAGDQRARHGHRPTHSDRWHGDPFGPEHPGWTQPIVATPRAWRC